MSHEKNREEANRWLVTGKDDLDTAIILKEKKKNARQECINLIPRVKQLLYPWKLLQKNS